MNKNETKMYIGQGFQGVSDIISDVLANGHVFDLVHQLHDTLQGILASLGIFQGAPSDKGV